MCSTVAEAEDGAPSSTTSGNSVNSMSMSGSPILVTGSTGTPGMKMPDTTNRINPNRRSNKPIMEKRRRARINNCLNELKAILLEAMRKDPARHSKLEKADILELTVTHLKSLHRTTNGMGAIDINQLNARFRAGFTECINEVGRFLSQSAAVKSEPYATGITTRLLGHLADCLGNPSMMAIGGSAMSDPHPHRGMFKFESDRDRCSEPNTNYGLQHRAAPQYMSNSSSSIISLVPSRLPSGEFAFVVPGFNSSTIQAMSTSGGGGADSNNNNARFVPTPHSMHPHQHHPMLLSPEVPLELTVSPPTISPAAYSVHKEARSQLPLPAHSQLYNATPPKRHPMPVTMRSEDYQGQQPLSLVTPKREETDMSCWRPW